MVEYEATAKGNQSSENEIIAHPVAGQIVAHYADDLVWDSFAPGFRQTVVLRTARRPDGNHAVLMHQALAEEVGIVELQHHIALLLFIMGEQSEWVPFTFVANQVLPKSGRRLPPPPKRSQGGQGELDL